MFTQCPECGVAFRVTADVLKQAAGKVRCGGCGIAFNALEHLSEEKPHVPERRKTEPELPELSSGEPPELEPDEAPKTISAEQSAALLKTLDELAGEDIRIEDTGVEWRVIGTDDDTAAADEDDRPPPVRDLREEPDLIADTGSMKFVIAEDDAGAAEIDEILEDSPTPVDQFITDTPPQIDAPEIFEEMRFDDNTPLPEDFDLDTPSPAPEPVVEAPEPVKVIEDPQVDLELGEPDDWEDLLDEVDEPAREEAPEDASEPTAEAQAEVDEHAADAPDSEPAAENDAADVPLDVDTQFAIQAEAMGIDLSGLHEKAEAEDVEAEGEPAAAEDVASETTIDEDLIAAAFETEAAAREQPELELVVGDEDELELAAVGEEEEAAQPDTEPAFAEIDEAEEPEELAEEPEVGEIEDFAEPVEEFEPARIDEAEEAAGPDEEPELAETEGEPEFAEDELVIELDEADSDEAELLDEFREEPVDEQSLTIRLDGDALDGDESGSGEHHVPEMTEEEMTINMLIDQDLLSVAVEDEDGFASTIVQVQPDRKVEAELEDIRSGTHEQVELEADGDADLEFEADVDIGPMSGKIPLVETIIMEGESIRGEEDDERNQKNKQLGAALKARQAEEDLLKSKSTGGSRIGMIAAAVLLALVLVLQFVHQSRDALATIPAFNDAVGPVYRMLGQPLTPAWDIKGWRFEATKGSTDDTEQLLTIYSRIGNQSDGALPYPLVHVSLTDRFEDIIGSRVLEPGEYLGGNADPRELVPAGNTFNAVISIESPAAEATGFKLNVCYRLAGGQLRCAIEDFK